MSDCNARCLNGIFLCRGSHLVISRTSNDQKEQVKVVASMALFSDQVDKVHLQKDRALQNADMKAVEAPNMTFHWSVSSIQLHFLMSELSLV